MSTRHRRVGAASLESVLVLASFVVATIIFGKLAELVVQAYFNDGNQVTSLPYL